MKRPPRAAQPQRGFTLLEVMISLAILAVALVALSNLNGGAVEMHAYARRASEASLLLRGKMLDLEDQLQKEGFSNFNDEKHGDFSQDGAPDYAWSAEILKPDVSLDPAQLLSLLGVGGNGQNDPSKLGAAGGALAGALGGNPSALQGLTGGAGGTGGVGAMMAGPLGGMLTGQAKTFIETLKKSVREVRITVSWQDGKQRRDVSASQMVVILPETVGHAGDAPAAVPGGVAAPNASGAQGQTTQPLGTIPGALK